MPDTTPIYGFPYPCPGEVISPLAFTNLANAIDAKLLEVNDDRIFALNRPNVDLDDSSSQVIPAGANTVLTTSDSTYTFSTAGVWVVWIEVSITSAPPTIAWQHAEVRQNAVARFAFGADSENNNPVNIRPEGPIIAAAGDVITATFMYIGTGTATVRSKLSAKLLCRIP